MKSYDGTVTILAPDHTEPIKATVVIDDVTRPSWVGIIRLLEGRYGGPPGDIVQVVLHEAFCPGLGATARLMVPVEGLPTLRGESRFSYDTGSEAAGA